MATSQLREALTMTPEGNPYRPILLRTLSFSHRLKFEHQGRLWDIEMAITHQRRAIELTPKGHRTLPGGLEHLGFTLLRRFEHQGELSDIDEAIQCLRETIRLTHDEDRQKPTFMGRLGLMYANRHDRLGDLSDLDKSIDCHLWATSHLSDLPVIKAAVLNDLGSSYRLRFTRLGNLADVNQAILSHKQGLSLCSPVHPLQRILLLNLGLACSLRFGQSRKVEDIEEAITHQTRAVSLTPENDPTKAIYLSYLGVSYKERFLLLREPADIQQVIILLKQAIDIDDEHPMKPIFLYNLGNTYLLSHGGTECANAINNNNDAVQYNHRIILEPACPEQIIQAANCFRKSALSFGGRPTVRFRSAFNWGRISTRYNISSPIEAYQRSIEILTQVVWLGTTVERRYEEISQIRTMVSEAAATAIQHGDCCKAVEWLEEGRSIVWKQMLQLRTPLNDLRTKDEVLASRLEQVARALESTALSRTTSALRLDKDLSLEDDAQRHRRLAEEWERLLREARALPGFESFLRPKRFSELANGITLHPVVFINTHPTRCDALIMHPSSDLVTLVPLQKLSYRKAQELQTQLLASIRQSSYTRKERRPVYSISQVSSHFEDVMCTLWDCVVKPILEALGYLTIPPPVHLARVIWCPTGPLAFLPLHAAGNYQEQHARTFKYIVSSYTPTLSALLSTNLDTAAFQGIAAIGQPATVGYESLPGTVDELGAIKRHAKSLAVAQLEGAAATADATLDAMVKYSWVHLACHASQNLAAPLQSAFHLHNSSLDLATISNKQLKNKGLAFLSACETATGDEGLPEEAVHLASGMLMAGYPTVIATMWSINDSDAPLVAEAVYSYLLRGENPDAGSSAEALHHAVQALRNTVGEKSFIRWVPFIHIGQ